jgi:type IX secretion system PorP/SprF family membrane protein
MKNIYKIIGSGLLVLVSFSIHAQQDAMFTHYMYNTLAVNPAYAGSRDVLSATVLHRSQWVDFEGAPTTQTLTLHSPVKSKKIGLGLSLINDKVGPVKSMGAYADFAYILKLDEKSKLAFGLKGGITSMQVRLNSLQLNDETDAAFQNNISSKYLPNFGFGMYYSRKRFYAGVSVPRMLENNFRTSEMGFSSKNAQERRHYYAIAGAVFRLSDNVDLKPTSFVKATMGAPIEADITSSFIFYKRLTIGAMFRTGDAAGILAGFNINDQFQIGYSYDWSYGLRTFKYNYGSHEIMIRYDMKPKERSAVKFF